MAILPLLRGLRQGHTSYMFTVYCSGHASRILLFPEHIEELHNSPDGIELRWRCTCGTTGTARIFRAQKPLRGAA